jgi:hypothetical protein
MRACHQHGMPDLGIHVDRGQGVWLTGGYIDMLEPKRKATEDVVGSNWRQRIEGLGLLC